MRTDGLALLGFVALVALSTGGSGPNLTGSYSHNAFDFGTLPLSPALPAGFDVVTFLAGTVLMCALGFAGVFGRRVASPSRAIRVRFVR